MLYSSFEAEVLGIIGGATGTHPANTPHPTTPGSFLPQTLFTSVEAAKVSLVEYLKDAEAGNRGRPAPPYVIVLVGNLQHDRTWGVRSRTDRASLSVAVVDIASQGASQRTVHALAESVRSAINDGDDTAPFATFQSPAERGRIDSSGTNPIFANFAVDSKVQLYAALVEWTEGLIVGG